MNYATFWKRIFLKTGCEMKNIVWLASYPKSGNTWFRIFLTNLLLDGDEPADINQLEKTPIASERNMFDDAVGFEAADLSYDEVDRLRPAVYEQLSREAEEVRFMKIHDAYTYVDGCKDKPLVSLNAARGAVYILRNPLDVVISFANHSGISIDKAIERATDEKNCFCARPGRLHNQLRQRLLSWSSHVLSWVDAPGIEVHVMTYEEMKRNPLATFTAAIHFAGLQKTRLQVEKALAFSDFKEIQLQEKEKGFKEKPVKCESFFRKGNVGDWKEVLTDAQVQTVIRQHRDVMTRFGYLDQNGEPV